MTSTAFSTWDSRGRLPHTYVYGEGQEEHISLPTPPSQESEMEVEHQEDNTGTEDSSLQPLEEVDQEPLPTENSYTYLEGPLSTSVQTVARLMGLTTHLHQVGTTGVVLNHLQFQETSEVQHPQVTEV